MAKGKGKGRDEEGGSGNCCCLICCCILLPIILLLIGVFILVGGNTRVERINEYNRRAKIWMEEGVKEFANASFALDSKALYKETMPDGSYYPVRDTCSKKGDPAEKCLAADAMYYKTDKDISMSTFTVDLKSNGEYLVNESYKNSYEKVYTPSDLGCSKDTSKCSSKCHSRGGSWDSSRRRCTVVRYLNEVCYRVKNTNGKWKLDVPPTWMTGISAAGCYYNNDFNPAVYSKTYTDSVRVSVRHYQDAFISADELTSGCSYSSPSSSSCFGMSRSEQNKLGGVLTVVGLLLTALEVGLLVFMCLCCRDTITGMRKNKKKDALIPNAEPVPYAQPSYAPAQSIPAQSAYAPQPGYMPSQPGFVPTAQPGFVPTAQPGFVPTAQPAYAPQPSYMPQPSYNV